MSEILCLLLRQDDGGYRPVPKGSAVSDPPQGAVRLIAFRTGEAAQAFCEGYREAGGDGRAHRGEELLAGLVALTEPGHGVRVEDRGGLASLETALRWQGLGDLAGTDPAGDPIVVTIPADGTSPSLIVAGRTFRIEGDPDDVRVVGEHDAATHLVKQRTWYDEATRCEPILITRDGLTWETDLAGLRKGARILRALARHLDEAETEHRTDALAEAVRRDPAHIRYAALMRDGWRMFKPANAYHGGAILFPPDGLTAPSRDINSALLARLLRARLVRYPLEIQRRRTMGLPIDALTYTLEAGDCAAPLALYDAIQPAPRRAGKKLPTVSG